MCSRNLRPTRPSRARERREEIRTQAARLRSADDLWPSTAPSSPRAYPFTPANTRKNQRRGDEEEEGGSREASKLARRKRQELWGQLDRSLIPHHIIYATDPRPPRPGLTSLLPQRQTCGTRNAGPHVDATLEGTKFCRFCIFTVGCGSPHSGRLRAPAPPATPLQTYFPH